MKYENCTFYTTGEFMGNVLRRDCRSLEIDIVPYAQYPAAIQLTFVKKGCRTKLRTVICYHPYLVVVPTDRAIEPDDMMVPLDKPGFELLTQQSRYSSFDDGWRTDFDAKLVAAGVPILADYRRHNPNEKHTPAPEYPHASDCPIWVDEPCDCAIGKPAL